MKVFAARSTLQLHVEIFHDQIKRNSIKSDVLNEVDDEDLLQSLENEYISKANIKNEKFHETFFYSCDICQKQFSINKSLKTHIRSNATEKSLKCEKCDNSFSIKSNLNMHREFQCGESSKDYSCNQCHKQFSLQVHLKIQSLTHARERCLRLNLNNKQDWLASGQNQIFQVF